MPPAVAVEVEELLRLATRAAGVAQRLIAERHGADDDRYRFAMMAARALDDDVCNPVDDLDVEDLVAAIRYMSRS